MRRVLLTVGTIAVAVASRGPAQGVEPLRKTDVVRLLASPLIAKGEVADLIRRNCLAFRPTERDWADLRALGADAGVLASVGGCAGKTIATRAAAQPLTAVPLVSQLDAPAGGDATIAVMLKRGGEVHAGVNLVLRGRSPGSGAPPLDLQGTTDENGIAQFHFPVGTRATTYTFTPGLPTGAPIAGSRPLVLVVHPGKPATVVTQPAQLDLTVSRGDGPLAVTVAVTDSFGNALAREAVQLRGEPFERALTGATDSLGLAAFLVARTVVRRAGTIAVFVRDDRLGSLPILYSDAVSPAATGFLSGTTVNGIVRKRLGEPLVFEVRSVSGKPLVGKAVSFRAENADIVPDSAMTDSAGQARVLVTLGMQAGLASVTASVDSVRKRIQLHAEPSADAGVVIEQNGVRVNGGQIVVPVDTAFTLHVSARDVYGNAVMMTNLVRGLEEMRRQFNLDPRLLRIVRVDSDSAVATLTFFPAGLGRATLRIADAVVGVAVVRARAGN